MIVIQNSYLLLLLITQLFPEQYTQSGITPKSASSSANWAGYAAQASPGGFSFSDATWDLPCMLKDVLDASASFWVGIGGFGSGGGNTVIQAGTDVHVDQRANVTYSFWVESYGPLTGDHVSPAYSLLAPCGTQMYVEADSPSDGYNAYYVIDGGGVNRAFTENWPVTDGSSGECFTEDPNTGAPYFADFDSNSFDICYINGSALGDWSYNTWIMLNTNGQTMAYPGVMYNSGESYTIYWARSS